MPRPAPAVRVAPTVRPTVRARRPPAPLIDVLVKPEAELRARVREIESSEVFQRLLRSGAVARRGLRGRIPRGAYEEYMQQQFIEFVREYDIDAKGDWRTDFLRPDALSTLRALAHKYGAPPAALARFVRYLRSMSWSAPSASRGTRADEAPPDVADYAPGVSDVDVSEAAAVAEAFVERHGVSQMDFIADFIHGDGEATALARKYGADVAEVQRVLELVDAVQIADAATEGRPSTPAPAQPRMAQETDTQVMAWVGPAEDADDIDIEFDAEAGYGLHYRIDPSALGEGERDPAVQALLEELRWINERRSLVARLAAFLCRHQTEFFRTGELFLLKPVSQAEVARRLGEHQSRISRAIRDKYVDSPHGTYALQFLCQRTGDVVRRILVSDPSLSDKQVQELLRTEYDRGVSRRTVNHHRHKLAAAREPHS